MSDLIDRQAAIDAISTMFAPTPTQKDMVEDCLEIIDNLPPAQPEITEEDVKLYCRQRCLVIITAELFKEMTKNCNCDAVPPIETRHGLLIPDATLPRKGCYHCMFREGNLCKFLPASVPVVEYGKRYQRHKDCPLVEV